MDEGDITPRESHCLSIIFAAYNSQDCAAKQQGNVQLILS